jgi:hypothetical protein
MEIHCPSCRLKIPLDDLNPSTDVTLCRRCGKTHSFAVLSGATTIDLHTPPSGSRFEVLASGFTAEATTRSLMAVFLVPFTCVWAGMSVGNIYGRQILHGQFNPTDSFMGLPFLLGSVVLVGWCAMLIGGVVRVTRQGDELDVFTGVGPLGWRRRYCWSDIRTVREGATATMGRWGSGQGRSVILEGRRRIAFGTLLTEERRYFMLQVMQKMLATAYPGGLR